MKVLYILGSIGGIIVGIDCLVMYAKQFLCWYGKYQKMKHCYENRKVGEKPPMGFMTEKERTEIEDRLTARKRA